MAILGQSGKQEDQVYVVILVVISAVAVLAILGPIGVLAGLVTVIIGMAVSIGHVGSVVVAAGGAVLGMMLVGPKAWLIGPANDMAEVYRVYLFDGFRWDMEGLGAYYTEMLAYGPSWPYFSPLGIFAGGIALTVWNVYGANPLRQTARGKRTRMNRPSLRFLWASRSLASQPAHVPAGTLVGVDNDRGRPAHLSDAHANTHTLVLGTTGSGKTVTVLNLVESAIHRKLPMVYIDGKGDHALASSVVAYARARGRPAYLFSMSGDSCRYNPLATGGFSAKKDRIIELREWSEDHYRKLAEGYLQMVFKVLDACGTRTDLTLLADYLSTDKLMDLIRRREKQLGDRAQALIDEVEEQAEAESHVESLRAEIRNLARSEIGHLFETGLSDVADGAGTASASPVLELSQAIASGAVVYFCLPALQFPALAETLGKVVINDLKAVAYQQLTKSEKIRQPIYTIFDEFSVFAGEQVLNVINMGRSAGIHAVLATQSVADIGRAVEVNPDHFIRQVFSSCNSYLIQRLNAPEDAVAVAELIGTRDSIEHTAQIDSIGSTGLGSAKLSKTFVVHPDVIKQLPQGEAVFVNKNDGSVRRVKIRLGPIAR